jgi:hypothetical protein
MVRDKGNHNPDCRDHQSLIRRVYDRLFGGFFLEVLIVILGV